MADQKTTARRLVWVNVDLYAPRYVPIRFDDIGPIDPPLDVSADEDGFVRRTEIDGAVFVLCYNAMPYRARARRMRYGRRVH